MQHLTSIRSTFVSGLVESVSTLSVMTYNLFTVSQQQPHSGLVLVHKRTLEVLSAVRRGVQKCLIYICKFLHLVCWQTLKAARAWGDFLLVGIHSDQIVRCSFSRAP